MAKSRKGSEGGETIAGFSPAQWKRHMDADEDWTERLEGASEAVVGDVVAALEHGDAGVRALACSLAYGLGVEGLGDHAAAAVARIGALAEGDAKAKVRGRARVVHEGLAGELERVTIRRELPWLAGFSEDAVPAALSALDDGRDVVRLQVYLWWANAPSIPTEVRGAVADKLAALSETEADEVSRRAAAMALAHVRA